MMPTINKDLFPLPTTLNGLVFLKKIRGAFCEVKTEVLTVMQIKFSLHPSYPWHGSG
jgi:hypothetical protein